MLLPSASDFSGNQADKNANGCGLVGGKNGYPPTQNSAEPELSQEERDSDWNSQTNSERNFTVYIPNKSGYIQSTGTDFGTYAGRGTGLAVDITRCFVGKITQLNRWGVVSIDIEPAGRRTPASATIYAYTLEGDHLKVTNLAQYDPDHETSPLYDQYLSNAHRTTIHLEEVTVR